MKENTAMNRKILAPGVERRRFALSSFIADATNTLWGAR